MPAKIATVRTFEDAADRLVRAWQQAGQPKLLRLEGFDGVGKTGLGKLLAEKLQAVHVKGDDFIVVKDVAYPECLDLAKFGGAIKAAIGSDKPVILDAVCLNEVAPQMQWGRGLVVYIKRLSFNNTDPIWHGQFRVEDEPPNFEVSGSIVRYHQSYKPHETADLIIELPEEGHQISTFDFDRSHCYDPAGAEVITGESA